ncbi:MAG TPA: hypothetical protein VHA56_00340 [Mucilaginibacter sp.]|nr:hypothetical protein [Mucilaginibacter sp.]
MKTIKLLLFLLLFSAGAKAQSADLTQLILDIEKLTQLKGILTDMKTGYQIINGGYNQVKQIASGNFSLHSTFLNGLLQVSPAVASYGRIADIALKQSELVSEYKRYNARFQSAGFHPDELAYLARVYSNLLKASLQNVTALADILLAGKLRMSDAERLSAIDRLYASTEDQLTFLRQFNQQAALLAAQRQRALDNTHQLQKLYEYGQHQ